MTEITVTKRKGSVTEVESRGHADYAEKGMDIVCAGISTILQTALLGLLEVAKINVKYVSDEKEGYLGIKLPSILTVEERHDADVILDTMLCALYDFYTEYSDYLKLEVK